MAMVLIASFFAVSGTNAGHLLMQFATQNQQILKQINLRNKQYMHIYFALFVLLRTLGV